MPPPSTLLPALRGACALLAALLCAAAGHAAPKPLSESELSAVRGADGSILAGLQGASSSADGQNPLSGGLAAAFGSSTGPSTLDAAQFAAALQAHGLSAAMIAGYDGQAVAQTVVDARPVSFSFDASDLLKAGTGLSYTGASMGLFTMTNFDARGTTLWVWHH